MTAELENPGLGFTAYNGRWSNAPEVDFTFEYLRIMDVNTPAWPEHFYDVSIGTSGTIFVSSAAFYADPLYSLHSFAHAVGGYHLLGCILSAASCNRWLMEDIFQTKDYEGGQAAIDLDQLGENHVFFLPYLMGERSPSNDTHARGTFIGMTGNTSRVDLLQAVLEGVAFAVRDYIQVTERLGLKITATKICGGGVKSALWRTILANVLSIDLESTASEQGAAQGSAMLSMVACGAYKSVAEVCEALVVFCGNTVWIKTSS